MDESFDDSFDIPDSPQTPESQFESVDYPESQLDSPAQVCKPRSATMITVCIVQDETERSANESSTLEDADVPPPDSPGKVALRQMLVGMPSSAYVGYYDKLGEPIGVL